MSQKVGFVILTHSHPSQLLRLVQTLRRVYDNPPIACHHDFNQCPLAHEQFPSSVRFVSPYMKTRWAQFSIVAATLSAIELLYRDASPDWFFVLSGADYPTMRADTVVQELMSSGADALLDYREVTCEPSPLGEILESSPVARHYDLPSSVALAWRRFVGVNAWVPTIRSGPRVGRHTFYLPFNAWQFSFPPDFKCYYGDFWFGGNRRVAEILRRPNERHMQLRRYLARRVVPDECYFHTVLANSAELKINKEAKRYSHWDGGPGLHPNTLAKNDLEVIGSSRAYFARKFLPNSPLLNEIDKTLL